MPQGVDPVSIGVSALQTGVGLYQTFAGQAKMKRLLGQRSAFKTAPEVFDALNMAKNAAQTGFGADTMSYLTNQNDRSLTSSLQALTSLGGDPNDVAGIYDRSFQNIFKVGAENEQLQMQKFNQVYAQLDVVRQNKEAEWASEQAIIKDKMAAAAQQIGAGQQNMQSGVNMGLTAYTSSKVDSLYDTKIGGIVDKKVGQQFALRDVLQQLQGVDISKLFG